MIIFKVKQNKNSRSTAYGKWYGSVTAVETMSYQDLCKHIAEHNSVYGEDVCLGVANKLQSCILEQLLEGKKVQFGNLGTFYLSAKSEGADNEEDFSVGVNVKGLFLRFRANRQDINDLSSKTLKKRASFINIKDLIASKAKSNSSTSGTGTNPSSGTGTTGGSTGGNTGGNTGGDTGDGPQI